MKFSSIVVARNTLKPLSIVVLLCVCLHFTRHFANQLEGKDFYHGGDYSGVSHKFSKLNKRYYSLGTKENLTLPPLLAKYREQMRRLLQSAAMEGKQFVIDNLAEIADISNKTVSAIQQAHYCVI